MRTFTFSVPKTMKETVKKLAKITGRSQISIATEYFYVGWKMLKADIKSGRVTR